MENNSIKNIMIVGTGGQGVVLASEILVDVALYSGLEAKKSEIHGMSQRGGVVSSHVRYGKKVFSPLMVEGTADILLSFELAEAARWLPSLSDTGRVITNTQKIVPPVVSTGLAAYPENAESIIRDKDENAVIVDAQALATELGNPRLVNTILLGITSTMLDLSPDLWEEVVAQRVPAKFKELNMKAFALGRSL